MIDRDNIEKAAGIAMREVLRRHSYRPVCVHLKVDVREPRPAEHFEERMVRYRRRGAFTSGVKPELALSAEALAAQPPFEAYRAAEEIVAVVGELVHDEDLQVLSETTSVDWALGRDREVRIDFERVS